MAPGSQHGELMMQEVAVLKSTTAVLAAPQSGSPQPPRPDMNSTLPRVERARALVWTR